MDPNYYSHDGGNNKSWSKPVSDIPEAELGYDNVRQQPINNDTKRPLYRQSDPPGTTISQPMHKPAPDKSLDNLEKLAETKLKLEKLKILLDKHYSTSKASEILAYVIYLVSQGLYDFLDERLTWLRNIDPSR